MTTKLFFIKAVERFWDKVDMTYSCWLWRAHKDAWGYGTFWYDNRTIKAHRYSYELFYGKIPDTLSVDHLCRNPACVNPAHLDLTPIRDNILRGNGWGAKNARKTHCSQGHEFSPKNTYYRKNGSRICKTCDLDGYDKWLSKNREKKLQYNREYQKRKYQLAHCEVIQDE